MPTKYRTGYISVVILHFLQNQLWQDFQCLYHPPHNPRKRSQENGGQKAQEEFLAFHSISFED